MRVVSAWRRRRLTGRLRSARWAYVPMVFRHYAGVSQPSRPVDSVAKVRRVAWMDQPRARDRNARRHEAQVQRPRSTRQRLCVARSRMRRRRVARDLVFRARMPRPVVARPRAHANPRALPIPMAV